MMFDFYSLVYDHKQKFYGRVIATDPGHKKWDNESTYLLLEYVSGAKPEKTLEGYIKSARKDLQRITSGTYVEVNIIYTRYGGGKGIAKVKTVSDKYLTICAGDGSERMSFNEIGPPQPEGYKPEPFVVGQLVYLAYEHDYLGVVHKIHHSPEYGTSYKVYYFHKNQLKQLQAEGITSDSISNLTWPGWKLAPYDGEDAPRIRMSESDRKAIRVSYRIQLNSGNSPFNDRYGDTNFHARQAIGKLRKANGRTIAKALASVRKSNDFRFIATNADEIALAFNSIERRIRNIVFDRYAFSSLVRDQELLDWCYHCNAVEVYDQMNYSNEMGISFCRNCAHEFSWSETMDDYIRLSSSVSLYETYDSYMRGSEDDRVTVGWVRSQNDYRMVDGVAMSDYAYDEWSEDNENDDEYDEDDHETGGELNGYHGTYRVWREVWADKSYLPLGLEVEAYCKSRWDTVAQLREAFPGKIYLERDGSLNDAYGFEIISQPYGKKEWEDFAPKLLNLLKKNGAIAYNEPAGVDYGIHININRKYLTSLQENRMFMFLLAEENRDFVTAIAQRSRVYGQHVGMGGTPKSNQKVSRLGGLQNSGAKINSFGRRVQKKKLAGIGKYTPINLHRDRMEIRIFQSTLNGSSFMKNLEFTWALVEWTSLKAATGTSWMHTDFVKWLANRPHVERDFPHLMAFLRKPKFARIDDNQVKNTWLELMSPATRRSISADVMAMLDSEVVEDSHVPVIAPAVKSRREPVEDVALTIAA